MKISYYRNLHILVGAIVLMSFNLVAGQETTVWFEKGATWHYRYGEGMEARSAGYEKLEVIGDTIFDTIGYKITGRMRMYSTGDSVVLDNEYLRYDAAKDQVFRYSDSMEYLLYDFSAQEGDTILVKTEGWRGEISYCHLLVDSIRVEELSDSVNRRVQYTSEIENYSFTFAGRIIEGIGSEVFIYPVNEMACDAGCAKRLRCFEDSKIAITSSYTECDGLYVGGARKLSLSEELKVFPNPANGIIYVNNHNSIEIDHLELLDQTGRIYIVLEKAEYINLEMLNAGVYILKVVMSDQSVVVKKIIKN